jgi:hypothetical protein
MITAVCAVVFAVLLGGSELADRRRTRPSERSRIAENAGHLDRFQWAVPEDLAEACQAFLDRDRTQRGEETSAFIAAREGATRFAIPDEETVYRLGDQILRERGSRQTL